MEQEHVDNNANRSLGALERPKTPKSVGASTSQRLMQSDWPHYWQDDASLSSCLRCSKAFTFFRRRHHCRVCGKIYCDACSSRRVPAKDYGYSNGTKEVRACEQCYKEAAALLTEHERYRIDVDLLSVRARHQKALDELQNTCGLKEHLTREPFKVVDRELTASMKVFIDSTDKYSTKFGKRSSDIASLLHRLPPDNRQDLLDLHSRHLKVVLAQCLQRRDLSLFQWRHKLQDFTETTVWHLATLPKSVFWMTSNAKAMNPSMEAGEMHSTGRFKVDDGGVLEPFVHVVGLGDGNPDESYCFAGVLFEGNVVNRHMKTTRGYSNVAVLDCGLHESALSTVSRSALTSLRSLINNESTVSFAHSLVARIVNLNADIIFTRESVSHDAQQLLMLHDVTVIANVSKRNLRALAKSTGASILSVAALHNRGIMSQPERLLGHCLEFEVQLYSLPSEERLMTSSSNATGDRKSFVRVRGKLQNQFKTWVLRGLTKPELRRMHDVINVALFVSYNAMLEISFVFDCCGAYYNAVETLDSTDEKEMLAAERSESMSSNHRDSLDDVKRSLSMSQNRYRFVPIESSPFTFSEHTYEAMNSPKPSISDVSAPTRADWMFGLPKLAEPNREPPPARQLPLLHSSLHLSHYWLRKVGGGQCVQCMDPKLVALEFYGDHDTTLGRFLHRICFDTSLVCSAPSCLKSMKDHLWCITHGDGKITVEIERLPQPLLKGDDASATPSGEERTLTWLWCKQCRRRTSPVSELSSRTLNWSLGKMLEHFFYDDHVRSRHPSCSHQLNRDVIRTFCRGSSLAIFSYSSSKPFSLRLSKEITIDTNLLRSRTYHVVSRLRALLSIICSVSLRATVRNAPALAIDSAIDSRRQTIERQYEWIRQRSFEIEQSGSGPLAAIQLYLRVFAFAEDWGRHLNVHRTMLPLPRSGRSDALLSWLGTRPIPRCLRSGKWQVVPTFGNAILPIVPQEPSSFVAHALASFQHVAFINGLNTAQQMDVAVRNVSLQEGLRPLCLLSNPTMDRDEELSTIRHILSSPTPDDQPRISSQMSQIGSFSSLWLTHSYPGAVLVPCGEFGHVWITFAKKFHALRQLICGDNYTVVESLANSDKWEAQGGKSNATFSRSWCHRFVLKEISSTEGRTFCRISDDYFDYMKSSLFDDTPSALVPILGLFEVFRKKDGHSQVYLLMSNLLGGLHQRPQLVFDLKGKRHGRYVEESDQTSNMTSNSSWRLKRSANTSSTSELALGRSSAISMDELDVLPAAESNVSRHVNNSECTTRPDSEQVLLDENFAVYTLGQPLPLAPEQAGILQRAFENDSSLLCRLGIMDYSILCGVSEEPERQLVLGIIDYIRSYTLDKKVENKIKTLIERADPTVLPPVDYRLRFLSAAHRYFILAPNRR